MTYSASLLDFSKKHVMESTPKNCVIVLDCLIYCLSLIDAYRPAPQLMNTDRQFDDLGSKLMIGRRQRQLQS